MRRDARNRNNREELLDTKIVKYAIIGVAILTIIVLGLLIYSKNLNDKVKDETLSSEQIASILSNSDKSDDDTEKTSTEIGKSVNEAKNQLIDSNNTVEENTVKNETNKSTNVLTTNNITNTVSSSNSNNTTNSTVNASETKTETKKVELNFEKPVDGEIVRDFAVDSLVFSNTLQEWTTHTGIDIKADKTTVVKAAEKGTVKSIKNDPRYGLTVVIEHDDGFKTVYSNLLTSEFVVEGEKIEKGQSIGTVGNTAAFEIADDAHLHFEILKDSVQVDPSIYLKL